MKRIPFMCRVFQKIGRASPSAIFAGCNIGRKIPTGKCIGCPMHDEWWFEK